MNDPFLWEENITKGMNGVCVRGGRGDNERDAKDPLVNAQDRALLLAAID